MHGGQLFASNYVYNVINGIERKSRGIILHLLPHVDRIKICDTLQGENYISSYIIMKELTLAHKYSSLKFTIYRTETRTMDLLELL